MRRLRSSANVIDLEAYRYARARVVERARDADRRARDLQMIEFCLKHEALQPDEREWINDLCAQVVRAFERMLTVGEYRKVAEVFDRLWRRDKAFSAIEAAKQEAAKLQAKRHQAAKQEAAKHDRVS